MEDSLEDWGCSDVLGEFANSTEPISVPDYLYVKFYPPEENTAHDVNSAYSRLRIEARKYRTNAYMNYLKSNPELFRWKRIQWKANKLIGKRRLFRGITKDYYKQTFVDLFYNTTKVDEFVKLAIEEYGIDLRDNAEITAVKCLYAYFQDWGKVLFTLIRPADVRTKSLKGLTIRKCLAANARFLSVLFDSYADCMYEFESFVRCLDIDDEVIALVQPNYKEILADKKKYWASNEYYENLYKPTPPTVGEEEVDLSDGYLFGKSYQAKLLMDEIDNELELKFGDSIKSDVDSYRRKKIEWLIDRFLHSNHANGLDGNNFVECKDMRYFTELCREEYAITESCSPYVTAVQYLHCYFKDWKKVLFCVIRPDMLTSKTLKETSINGAIDEAYGVMIDILNSSYLTEFCEFILSLDLDASLYSLLQDDSVQSQRSEGSSLPDLNIF